MKKWEYFSFVNVWKIPYIHETGFMILGLYTKYRKYNRLAYIINLFGFEFQFWFKKDYD